MSLETVFVVGASGMRLPHDVEFLLTSVLKDCPIPLSRPVLEKIISYLNTVEIYTALTISLPPLSSDRVNLLPLTRNIPSTGKKEIPIQIFNLQKHFTEMSLVTAGNIPKEKSKELQQMGEKLRITRTIDKLAGLIIGYLTPGEWYFEEKTFFDHHDLIALLETMYDDRPAIRILCSNMTSLFIGPNAFRNRIFPLLFPYQLSFPKLKKVSFDQGYCPNELWEWTHLTALNLSACRMTEISRKVKLFIHLQTLTLISNDISFLPDEIEYLTSLKKLDLSKNQLSSLNGNLWKLEELEHLDISFNQLTELSDSIKNLKKLKILMINNNKLNKLPLLSLSCLAHLKEFSFHENLIPINSSYSDLK